MLHVLRPGKAFFFSLVLAAFGNAAEFTFDDTAIGQLPPGWTEAKTGEGEGSVWKVVSYMANGRANHALAQTSSAGPNAMFNLCVRSDAKYGDVEMRVRLKPVSGQNDQGGGLVWRYQDAKNYYVARWNPLENNFRLYHVIGGQRTQLASADVTATPGEWHTVRGTCRRDHLQCHLDGKLLLDVHDSTIPSPGAVGLWTKADAVTWFDDFSANALRQGTTPGLRRKKP
jgi:hypothetical protein